MLLVKKQSGGGEKKRKKQRRGVGGGGKGEGRERKDKIWKRVSQVGTAWSEYMCFALIIIRGMVDWALNTILLGYLLADRPEMTLFGWQDVKSGNWLTDVLSVYSGGWGYGPQYRQLARYVRKEVPQAKVTGHIGRRSE